MGMNTKNMPQIKSLYVEEDILVSLLPPYKGPGTLLVGDRIPCYGNTIVSKPTEAIALELKRQTWTEGLYVNQNVLNRVLRYKNLNGTYKNDFDGAQFLEWVKIIEENTAICDMQNKALGKGVFVPSGKKVAKGTFIPSSGIIKLDPTKEEFSTKVHCSALQDLNTPNKKIYGFIDPAQKGGILDLINHAPDTNELVNFTFEDSLIKARVATSNLKSTIKFYNGYAIMGLEAFEQIDGGEHGQQLLWSYARSCEYIENDTSKLASSEFLLFDKRNGETIDPRFYRLRKINIYLNTGNLRVHEIASLNRWELMEDSHEGGFVVVKYYDESSQERLKELLIEKSFLQAHLEQNPKADRIILDIEKMST